MNDTRIPPQNLDIERAVLGSMLIDESVVAEVLSTLNPPDFYLDSHRQIFAAIKTLSDQKAPIDPLTVADWLKKAGHDVSSGSLLSFNDVALPGHARRHAEVILETARKRKLLAVLREAESSLYESAADSSSIAAQLSQSISSAVE